MSFGRNRRVVFPHGNPPGINFDGPEIDKKMNKKEKQKKDQLYQKAMNELIPVVDPSILKIKNEVGSDGYRKLAAYVACLGEAENGDLEIRALKPGGSPKLEARASKPGEAPKKDVGRYTSLVVQ
jgi:hypothetical protein